MPARPPAAPSVLRSLRFALRVCFGSEVRFFLTSVYLVVILTLVFGL